MSVRFLRRAALAAVLAVPASVPRAWAQTVVVGPRSPAITVVPGGFVTVPVVADMSGAGGASLGSVTGVLGYDKTRMRFVSAALGTAGGVVTNADTVAGQLHFALANAAGSTGMATLVNATFQATGLLGDSANLLLTLSEMTAATSFADLLPSVVTTGAKVCFAAAGRYGDVDGNDTLKSNDALIIITQAVGLPIAPFSVVNGDVDGDGKVDSRDALLVLSFAVGLPTTPFRVGQLFAGGCGNGVPSAVAVQPGTASLVVGDVVPLSASITDSLGAPVHANLVWLSRDTTIVRAQPANIQAVAAGTTRVVVIAAPGVMDSATVSVTTTRHTWYADQAAAAGNAVEIGSPQYPFATIQAAVSHASSNDSVVIAAGVYGGGVHITRAMVVRGSAGTVLSPPAGPAIMVDSIGAADVVSIEQLRIAAVANGVMARGAGTVHLRGLVIDGSRGPAVQANGLNTLLVDSLSITSVAGAGVLIDSAATANLSHVRVDLVTGPVNGIGAAVEVRHTGTLFADSLDLRSGPLVVQAVGNVHIRRSQFRDVASGPLLSMSGVQTLVVDTSDVLFSFGPASDFAVDLGLAAGGTATLNTLHLNAGTASGLRVQGGALLLVRDGFVGFNASVFAFRYSAFISDVAQTRLLHGLYLAPVKIEASVGTSAWARADSLQFSSGGLIVRRLDSVVVRQAAFTGGVAPTLTSDSVKLVRLDSVNVSGAGLGGAFSIGPWAVDLMRADSVFADSLWVHRNTVGAIRFLAVGRARLTRSSVADHHASSGGVRSTVRLDAVRDGIVSQTLVDDRLTPTSRSIDVEFSGGPPNARIEVANATQCGGGTGVEAQGYGQQAESLIVRHSVLGGCGGTNFSNQRVLTHHVSFVVVDSNAIDSTNTEALGIYQAPHASIRGNVMAKVAAGILVDSAANFGPSRSRLIDRNTIACTGGVGIESHGGPATVTGNRLQGCNLAISLLNQNGAPTADVSFDTVTNVPNGQSWGILFQGDWTSPRIAHNDIGPGHYGSGAISVDAIGQTGIDSARVDSNTIHDAFGTGISLGYDHHGAQVRGNLIQRLQPPLIPNGEAGIRITLLNNGASAFVTGNKVEQSTIDGIFVEGGIDVHLDSNVVVDQPGIGVRTGSVTVSGQYNFLARNGTGLFGAGQVTMSNSRFENNLQFAASGNGLWDLTNNWWGAASGPTNGNGSWTARANMLTGINSASAAAAGGKIYVGGGSQTNAAQEFFAYDPVLDSWTQRASMLTPRGGAQLAVVNDTIYAFGGNVGATQVERYVPALNSWTSRASLPTGRDAPAVATMGGIIYVFGGRLSNASETNVVEAYNPATNTWTTKAPMLSARIGAGAVTAGGRIYVIGGNGQFGPAGSTTVQIYDPAGDSWTSGPSLPSARGRAGTGILAGRIYVVGGTTQFTTGANTTLYLDTAAGTWYADSLLASNRAATTAAVISDTLYLVGGTPTFGVSPGIVNTDRFVPLGFGPPVGNRVAGQFLTASPFLSSPPSTPIGSPRAQPGLIVAPRPIPAAVRREDRR